MADYDGAFNVRTGYILRLSVWLISQDINTNTSLVGYQYGIFKDGGSGWYNGYNDATHSGNIDGAAPSGSFGYNFSSYSYLGLASGTKTVSHNADGTKSISVSAYVDDNPAKPGGNLGVAGVSGTFALPTIPRATTPTISPNPIDAGAATTINLSSRASSSFTHELSYSFGSLTNQTSGLSSFTGVATSATFTPPMSLLNQIPNAASGVAVLTVITKNGGTTIGTRTVNITIAAPASVKPTISSVTASEATTTPALASIVGAYVRNLTRLNLAIVGAAGAYGSTIVSYKIIVAGQTINAVSGTTPSPINASGTVTISAEVTDSRGRVSSFAGSTITVLDYVVPQITTAVVDRSNSIGTIDNSTGTYIRVSLNAAVQSLINTTQRNELHYRVYTSPQGANTWTQRGSEVDTNALTFNSFFVITTGAPYALTSAFDVLIRVIDELGIITDVQRTISTGQVVMDLNGSAGVGFGKYHQYGRLDVLGDIYQDGFPVLDHNDWASGAEAVAGVLANKIISPLTLLAGFSALIPSGFIMPSALSTSPSGWLMCDGTTVSRTTYASLFAALNPSIGTGTVAIGASALWTLSGHNLYTGRMLYLTTTGALPTGLAQNTAYFAIRVSSSTFRLATSLANAIAGTAITTSGTQSGVHTVIGTFGVGNGSTTFNVPNLNGRTIVGLDTGQSEFDALGETFGSKTHTLSIGEMPSHTHSAPVVNDYNSGFTSGWAIADDAPLGPNNSNATGGGGAHNNVQPSIALTYMIKT